MRYKIPENTSCDYRSTLLEDWDYRYQGKHYCKKCYHYLFHYKICIKCNRRRKIYYSQRPPICKFCQVKNIPCIRCKKTQYTNGKITEYGPVCNVCAKYYTQYRKCSVCKQNDKPTSNRTLVDGSQKLLCQKCHSKTLPVCCSCGYRKMPFSYQLDQKPLCKTCSIEVTRNCKICGDKFPAGFGHICSDCHYKNALVKKATFISEAMSQHTAQHFINFSYWLKLRRGVLFTSTHIQNYQKYFFQIDKLSVQFDRLPNYEELLATFPHATQGKNLLVHLYFESAGVLKIDKAIKDKYANLNLIQKYLNTFKKDDYRSTLLQSYYEKLLQKFKAKRITFRSIRLALTPALKFLQYCDYFKNETPNMYILEGYLWIYPGQRSSLTEFTNFLSKQFSYEMKISMIPQAKLEKAHESQELLQQRLIKILRNPQYQREHQQYFFKILIGYLHNIHVPDNVYIDLRNVKKDAQSDSYIRLCREVFYLPSLDFKEKNVNLKY